MREFAARENPARDVLIVGQSPQAIEARKAAARTPNPRSFGLPPAFYKVTIAGYLGFLLVMAGAVVNAELALPLAIIAVFFVIAFGVPLACARLQPEERSRSAMCRAFNQAGIEIATGPIAGRAAAVQVLILPVLILLWGIVFALIAALE